jgi:glycosyltransferase involved in cell wall biosynthesis
MVEGTPPASDDPRVAYTWSTDSVDGWRRAAKALNSHDVAVVQHEYGIYPGPDGDHVVPMLDRLTVPSIVVLHTVLTTPSARQKAVLEQIVQSAHAVVTMTSTARDRLLAGYEVDPAKVTVIPHGAADHSAHPVAKRSRPHLLTWGLIGPGKGIEWAIRALAQVSDVEPRPTYTVAGKTHPKVLEHQGEAYRTSLQELAAELGVADSVHFDPIYRDDASLSKLIRSADVVLLPYDSREQVTSGVLIEAVAAGVPVVATPFPHAVEVLTDGPGLLVPFGDARAMANAIRDIITEPDLAAISSAPSSTTLLWPAVAGRYSALAHELLAASRISVPA